MKLAISNIAWDPLQDETVYSLMKAYGFLVWKLPLQEYYRKRLMKGWLKQSTGKLC